MIRLRKNCHPCIGRGPEAVAKPPSEMAYYFKVFYVNSPLFIVPPSPGRQNSREACPRGAGPCESRGQGAGSGNPAYNDWTPVFTGGSVFRGKTEQPIEFKE